MSGPQARTLHFLCDFDRGIAFAGDGEIDFVIWIIESRQGGEILLQTGLDPLARTDNRRQGRVKTCMRTEPLSHHAKPSESIPKRIEPEGNLHHNQNVEDV